MVAAVGSGNAVSPSGNVWTVDEMPIVRVNAVAGGYKELGDIPLRPGSTVCLRDIGEVKDATDIPTGYALVNGQRTVYMLVTKRADASTLAVVNAVKANLDRMQRALPADVELRLEFDQTPNVTGPMWGVGREGGVGGRDGRGGFHPRRRVGADGRPGGGGGRGQVSGLDGRSGRG